MNERKCSKWMGRLQLTAVQCNYKGINGQFINRLNDNEMLVEIIRELTRTEENKNVQSEQVLVLPSKSMCIIYMLLVGLWHIQ